MVFECLTCHLFTLTGPFGGRLKELHVGINGLGQLVGRIDEAFHVCERHDEGADGEVGNEDGAVGAEQYQGGAKRQKIVHCSQIEKNKVSHIILLHFRFTF